MADTPAAPTQDVQTAAPAAAPPQAAPQAPATVNVFDPTGEPSNIPADQLQAALSQGFTQASPEEVAEWHQQQKYGTIGQQAITGLESAGEAATFGGSTAIEKSLGVPGQDILARKQANPVFNVVGQVTGLVGSSIFGAGEGAALETVGKAAAEAAGLAAPTTFLSKVGSAAVKAAAENAMVAGGDEASKMFAGDPNQSTQTALTDIGLSALIGGGAGGMFGTVAPLWKATIGPKAGRALKALTDRGGGIEGRVETPMSEAIAKTGMDLAPEIRSGIAGDPVMSSTMNTLSQSESRAGRKLATKLDEFHQEAGETISNTLGKAPSEIPESFDKYNSGKSVGEALSKEYSEQIAPISQAYDEAAAKFKGKEVAPSIADKAEEATKAINAAQDQLDRVTKKAVKAQTSGDGEGALQAAAEVQDKQAALKAAQTASTAPGTIDSLQEKISNLAHSEGWALSPSSDIMREVARVQKELPNVKTINDLSSYIQRVGENMQSNPLNGSMTQAGGKIKSILRQAEGDLIGAHVGSEEGVAALEKYTANRQAFAAQAALKDQLDAALHLKGSVSGYGKRLAEAAKSDGEGMWNKLSGKGDAATLALLQKSFPKTAEAVRQAHLSEILSKAKTGDKINPYNIMTSLNKLSPQLKSFVVPAAASERIGAFDAILNHLKEMPRNYSNTARTMDAMWSGMPAGATAIVGALTGHTGAGLALAPFARFIGKEAPDAVKLAMLKFMGSSAPIDAGAFKTTLEFAKATIAGENLLSRATSNIFKAGREVLPQSAIPSESDRTKLDKSLKDYQKNPNKMTEIGGNVGHYLPDHAGAVASTASNAIQTLNALRPGIKQAAPLDRPQKPSPVQQAAYNRALDIAQQPLMVLHHLNNGTLNSQDVMLVQKLYPDLYTRIQQKVTEQLANATSEDGNTIPYATRRGLSKLMGQPLDSTLTPMGIMSAQPQPAQQPPQGPQAPVKHKTAALTKMSSHYETSAQASEADNNSRET